MRTHRSKLLGLVTLTLGLSALASMAACTPSDDGSDGPANEGALSPTPGKTPGKTPGVDDDTTPTEPIPAAKHFGAFTFQASKAPYPGTAMSYSAAAVFMNQNPLEGVVECESLEIVGSCGARLCALPTPGKAAEPYDVLPAGDVTAATPTQTESLAVNPQGIWTTTSPMTWSPGDALKGKVTGAPGGAPAFELSTIAPPTIVMTSPVLSTSLLPTTPIKHAKSTDLVAQWSTSGAGNARITLVGGSQGKTLNIQCLAPISSKQVVVSAALLGRFESPRVFMTLEATSQSDKRVDDWMLTVSALAPGVTPTGRDAKSFVELE